MIFDAPLTFDPHSMLVMLPPSGDTKSLYISPKKKENLPFNIAQFYTEEYNPSITEFSQRFHLLPVSFSSSLYHLH